MTRAFGMIAVLLVAGCQTAGGGASTNAVPEVYREAVARFIKAELKDPYSVRSAEISKPTTVFVGLVNGGNVPGVCVRYNAKNSFGAYIGVKPQAVTFRDFTVAGVWEPVFDGCTNESWSPFPELEGAT